MTETPDREKIAKGLKRIRTLRKLLLVIVIVFAPLVYLMAMEELPLGIVMSVGISWICLGVVIELMIGFSRCPACREYFHVRGMTGNLLARKCMHCGVPLKGEG
jgi:predicted membrane chloride channel (bestrophin family)